MKIQFSSRIKLFSLLILSSIIALGIYSYKSTQRIIDTARLLTHTTSVINKAEQILKLLVDIETGMRGFVITNDPSYLEPYRTGLTQLSQHMAKLDSLTAFIPKQHEKVKNLKKKAELRIAKAKDVVEARMQSFEKAQEQIANGEGKKAMDSIRTIIKDIQGEERIFFRERNTISGNQVQQLQYSFLSLAALIFSTIIILLVAMNNQLTKKLKAEENSKEAEKKFRDLMNFSPVGITLSTPQGNIIETNLAILKMLGFTSKEEFINTPAEELFFDKKDRAKLIESFKKDGVINNFEVQLKKKGGELIWVSNHVIPFKLTNNETLLLSASLDITQIKQAEEYLREYMHFFNQSNDLCIIVNLKGYFETVNLKSEKVLGYSQNEWKETPFIEFVHPEDVPAVLREFEKQKISSKVLINFVCRFRNKDGNYVPIEWNSNSNHEAGKIYAVGRDITERLMAEEKMKIAQEDAIKVNSELESFTYSVSHDLRAPLRSINGYAQILKEDYSDKFDEEGNRILEVVSRNAKRMGQLIDDLLGFSRLGRQELRKSTINMNELVKSILTELLDQQKGREIVLDVKPLDPSLGDANMIRQVWVNLLSNALKYSQKKEVSRIEVSCIDQVNAAEVVYYVKDNGAGFDMQYGNKLFGVFHRLHKAEDFEGTGVGLALAKRIIDRHKGRIWAEAKVNEGATFYFAIPKAQL